jgi:hypothetical protein
VFPYFIGFGYPRRRCSSSATCGPTRIRERSLFVMFLHRRRHAVILRSVERLCCRAMRTEPFFTVPLIESEPYDADRERASGVSPPAPAEPDPAVRPGDRPARPSDVAEAAYRSALVVADDRGS